MLNYWIKISMVFRCVWSVRTHQKHTHSIFVFTVLEKFIFIYVVTLPLAFVSSFGYFSAFIATFVFYVLVSMEVLAEEIEDPFGNDDNDLPTDTITERIKEITNNLLVR